MRCPICESAGQTIGVLCAECRLDLVGTVAVAPEQLIGRTVEPTHAALVDQWGRVHLLDPAAVIGRDLAGEPGLAIHAPSVSRVHAKLARDGTAWTVCDLGSANGTFVEDRRVDAASVLHAGDRVMFGQVAFYFLDHTEIVPVSYLIDSETVRPGAGIVTQQFELAEPTRTWSAIQISEPTGGGGGIVEIDGKQIQLTLAQLELVSLLVDRNDQDLERNETSGFVSVGELVGKLSLESTTTRDAHVRQLIRRVRRAFIKVGLGELIESRYGLGYRIRVLKARR